MRQPRERWWQFHSIGDMPFRRPGWAIVFLVLVGCGSAPTKATAQTAVGYFESREEFAGPFPSWTNIKSAYGAIGDGRADDTAAVQRALTELGTSGHSPVLFLPTGRYRITHTLTLAHALWLSVIGEDPDTTAIVWDGPQGGTMLLVNGLAYSRINRLSFDGRKTAAVAVEQTYDNTAPHFDTGNEYADDVFADVQFGIHGGFKGFGFAETSIVRARFLRNTTAGVALGNFNALDIWIWHSLFEDCGVGVTNDPGAGNFHVYGSVFRGSRVADLSIQNTGGFSARGNTSIGSRAFFVSGPTISHPAAIEIQGNRIIDPRDTTAIRLGNQGPGILLDNMIRSLPGAQSVVVWWKSFSNGADVVSLGNTFSVATPFDVNGRHVAIDDRVVARTEIDRAQPRLPTVLRNRHRKIHEVARGANAVTIQAIVNEAAKETGSRPVVHVPFGEYTIDRGIVVPPSDMQIVGDGSLTVLRWSGNGRGPVIAVDGPSTATLRDFRVDANQTADGMIVTNVDQKGARVYLQGVLINRASDTGLHVDHVSNALIDLVDIGHGYTPGVSVKVTDARATIFSGASAGNALSYDVSDGGDLMVGDTWYEGETANGFARVRGDAHLTIRGSRIAVPADRPTPAVDIGDLTGTVTLHGDSLDDRIGITGQSAKGQLLAIGLTREYRLSPFLTNTGLARVLMLNTRQRVERQTLLTSGTAPIPDNGESDRAFVLALLKRSRESVLPARFASVPEGATDLELNRIVIENGRKDLVVTARSRESQP
jgi:hypothetical protein